MDCINIIHDNRNPQRYVDVTLELANQGITDYKFWDAVCYTHSVVESINASHRMIVQYAKDNWLKEVCIAEDDLMFPTSDSWQYFLSKKPEAYDLYLSASYIKDADSFQICGFHLYFVHERFYDTFLEANPKQHIDVYFNDIKGDYVFCYPFAALQRPSYSANCMAMVNYNSVLKKEDIYNGTVHNI